MLLINGNTRPRWSFLLPFASASTMLACAKPLHAHADQQCVLQAERSALWAPEASLRELRAHCDLSFLTGQSGPIRRLHFRVRQTLECTASCVWKWCQLLANSSPFNGFNAVPILLKHASSSCCPHPFWASRRTYHQSSSFPSGTSSPRHADLLRGLPSKAISSHQWWPSRNQHCVMGNAECCW